MCGLNKFFISFNLILCVITSVISILPIIQEHHPRSGLLQSSVVTLYVIYLTWSGVSNSPGKYTSRVLDIKIEQYLIYILFLFVIVYRS